MDILAARKKAAERARARKKIEPEEGTAVQSDSPEQLPRPEGQTSLPAATTAAEPAAGMAPETEEPAASTEASPGLEAEDAAAAVEEIEMLSFRLGEEEYAVMVDDVKEVIRNRELTPVPNAPDYVLGVTALRGPILPVIDLCRRLGLPPGTRDEKSRILVVIVNDENAGLAVDGVSGVVRIHPDAVRPAPDTIEHGAEYVKGIARKDDRLYILLNLEKALGVQ